MRTLFKFFLLLSVLSTYVVAEYTFPKLTDRVVDQAHLLSSSKQQELTNILQQHEAKTTNQFVIVTLESLDGADIADYGYQLGRHWEVGQKDKDNGILLIVAPNERKVRIEVGYGLEGVVTDKIAHDIIQEKILPQFKKGDFEGGIDKGAHAILQALGGEYEVSASSGSGSSIGSSVFGWIIELILDFIGELGFFLIFLLSLVVEMFSGKSIIKRMLISAVVATVVAGIVYALVEVWLVAVVVWFFLFFMLSFGSSGGSGSSSGSYSSSGSSFGGFSGGGGSFGGGGASGSW